MEWLTITLASVLTLLTPAGAIIDTVLANTIRSQVQQVEQLAVRVDNTPNYQALQGKIDRVRISGQGIYPLADVRIEKIELETDPISLDLQRLQQRNSNLADALRKPASGAVRLVLRETDVNKALQSASVQSQIQTLINNLVPQREETGTIRYKLSQVNFDFLNNTRVAVNLELTTERENSPPETVNLVLEAGFKQVQGRKVEIIEPSATLNSRRISSRILKGFAEGLSAQLDLKNFESQGIIARILQLEIDNDKLSIAAFGRIEPQLGNTN
jgi:LmeA-like phospholipid-binding